MCDSEARKNPNPINRTRVGHVISDFSGVSNTCLLSVRLRVAHFVRVFVLYPSKLQWLPQFMIATLMLQLPNCPLEKQNPKQSRQIDRVTDLVRRKVRRRTARSMRSRQFSTRKGVLRARCAFLHSLLKDA